MIYSRDYSFVEIEAQNEEQARKYFEEGARRSPYQKELDTRVYRKINGYLSPKKIFKDLALGASQFFAKWAKISQDN